MSSRSGARTGDDSSVFEQVEYVEKLIRRMAKAVSHIERLQKKAVSAVSSSEEKAVNAEFQALCDESNQFANIIRTKLKELKAQAHPSASDYSVRKNQNSNLARKFKDLLIKYQMAQVAYSDNQKSKMTRQYRIVNPRATDTEIQQAVSESNAGTVFSAQVIGGGSRYNDAQRVLNDVESRHQELLKMTKLIQELQQMFLDLNDMIQSQDQLVDEVVRNVEETEVETKKAVGEMTEAVISKRSARKKKCILILCLVILLLVILAVVFFYFIWPTLQRKIDQPVSAAGSPSPPSSSSK